MADERKSAKMGLPLHRHIYPRQAKISLVLLPLHLKWCGEIELAVSLQDKFIRETRGLVIEIVDLNAMRRLYWSIGQYSPVG